jgi:prephenate dehydrogenase
MISNNSCIGIYSVGLLGASIGLSLKANRFSGTIIGFSAAESITIARESGAIDMGFGYDRFEEQIANIDILFLCSPIKTIINTIHKLSQCSFKNGCIITDVGSTKREIVAASSGLPSHVHFIGGHPMAGSEKRGPSAGDPHLFQNAIYAIAPRHGTPPSIIDTFATFLKHNLGCHTIHLEPDIHDSIVAATSHIPHILAVMLVNHVRTIEERVPGTFTMTAGGFRDMTRIASTPYPMWKDIFETNHDKIENQIDTCIAALQDMKHRLNSNTMGELFESASETRSKIASATKGFISPERN